MADTETKATEEVKVSPALERQLQRHRCNRGMKIVNPDLAVVIGHRSEYGNSGGIGYFSQVYVLYGNQSDMQEWQWRDRYSASRDRHDLYVHGIGQVKTTEANGQVTIKIELINRDSGNRTTTFTFKPLTETNSVPELTVAEQESFQSLVEAEIKLAMAELMRLWGLKNKMVGPHGDYVSYQEPKVKQVVCHPEIGVAAFVTEEQIDHRVDDPQTRYELFLVKHGQKTERLFEDHSYEKREGGAVIAIISLKTDRIVVNTRGGKREIEIK